MARSPGSRAPSGAAFPGCKAVARGDGGGLRPRFGRASRARMSRACFCCSAPCCSRAAPSAWPSSARAWSARGRWAGGGECRNCPPTELGLPGALLLRVRERHAAVLGGVPGGECGRAEGQLLAACRASRSSHCTCTSTRTTSGRRPTTPTRWVRARADHLRSPLQSCQAREQLLDPLNNQAVHLSPAALFESDADCVAVNRSAETWYQCSGNRSFFSRRPRWWYLALGNCDAAAGLYLQYSLLMTNADASSRWFHHFSFDEFCGCPLGGGDVLRRAAALRLLPGARAGAAGRGGGLQL